MRRTAIALLGLVWVAGGCGGGEEQAPPPTTTPPAATATTRPAAQAEEGAYELDVIVEGDPDEGPPPLTVHFQGYVEEDEGGPWKFAWDFGDGGTSTEQNPTHTYQKEGDYTATLTVTDQRNYTGEDEIDIFVENEE